MPLELVKISHIENDSEFAGDVHALLNDAFPEGAPNELNGYYARHGFPTATMLLKDGRRIVGHLASFERQIRIGDEAMQVALLGEIAVAADRRRMGLARTLVGAAHRCLQARAIPFAILFAFEPRVYASSGYKPMHNQTRFIDADGQSKILLYRGSMYAELLDRRWPDHEIDLCGTAV